MPGERASGRETFLPRDVGGLIGREESADVADLLRLTEAADRVLGQRGWRFWASFP